MTCCWNQGLHSYSSLIGSASQSSCYSYVTIIGILGISVFCCVTVSFYSSLNKNIVLDVAVGF